MGEQADALKHIAGAPPQRDGVEGADVLAADADRAGIGNRQPVDHAQQRSLAGTRRADDREKFTGLHIE